MVKSESKAMIEAYAKQSGKPVEEILAEIGSTFGYQKNNVPMPTVSGEKMSPIMEAIVAASTKGEKLDSKAMFESMMTLKMMEMMGAPKQDSGQNINEILAKNDEKWERKLASMESKAEKDALQRQLDDMKSLILNSSGSKKDEISDKFEKLSEKLDAEKERRFADALDNKGAEIEQLKEYMQNAMDDIRNQAPPKSSDEGFFDMMQKMERFDTMVRSRGKALGMTDEQIERQVAETTPLKQQILKDVFKTINRGIDAWSGKEGELEDDDDPLIDDEPPARKHAPRREEAPAEVELELEPTLPEEVLNIS